MGYDTALLNSKEQVLQCSCRAECPLDGKCRVKNLVHEATVRTADTTKKYVGLTASELKTRHAAHKTSLRVGMRTWPNCQSAFGNYQERAPSGQYWSEQARTAVSANAAIFALLKLTTYGGDYRYHYHVINLQTYISLADNRRNLSDWRTDLDLSSTKPTRL